MSSSLNKDIIIIIIILVGGVKISLYKRKSCYLAKTLIFSTFCFERILNISDVDGSLATTV